MLRTRTWRGFTILELMVVVAIASIAMAMAAPSFTRMRSNVRLRDTTRGIANALHFARAQAIKTRSNHVVFVNAALGTDPCGNPLEDPNGNPVPVLVINDGPPGSAGQNCCIDPGEDALTVPGLPDTFFGRTFATGPVPNDQGTSPSAQITFSDQNGNQTNWILFRPDGIPVGFNMACTLGQVGTGAGAIYGSNLQRDYGVVLTALGGVKVHSWDIALGAWTN